QDWLYDEGDDATKAVYVAKIEEIRALAGPVVQRYFDKVEAERQALQEKLEAEKANKKSVGGARRAKGAAAKAAAEGAKDDEMTDADAPKPVVEEA
nr:hypothetical protein [Escherichia coli]